MDETKTDVSEPRTPSHRLPPRPTEELQYDVDPPGTRVQESHITWKHNRFDVSVVTMVLISAVTFFMPLFNGLLGGAFGGFHAGRVRRALGAALIASVVVPGALYVLFNVFSVGGLRMFYGLGFTGWTVLHVIGLFLGALSGVASRPLFSGDSRLAFAPRVTEPPLPGRGDGASVPPEESRSQAADRPTPRGDLPNGPGRGE